MNYQRGSFSEIKTHTLNKNTLKQVTKLFNEAASSPKIDEHGNWEFGASFDTKGRGSALNWDLYGIGRDYHSKRLLIVVQIRQYVKARKNYYPQIRKSYFLIGRNEDNTAFAHPINSRVIHAAIAAEKDVVRACQNWIFGHDYAKIYRQGDVCLVPVSSKNAITKAQPIALQKFKVDAEGSHLCECEETRQNSSLYVKNPSLFHLPKTHPDFVGLPDWYKIVHGRRGSFYNFAAPTID